MTETCDWDKRWQERRQHPLEPDPWLVKVMALLPSSPLTPAGDSALDLACGLGRNALYLALEGWQVTAVDGSSVAVEHLRNQCSAIDVQQLDLTIKPQQITSRYDLVLQFFYFNRQRLHHFMQWVRPGGIMVVRTFSSAGNFPGQGPHPDFTLQPGELLEHFEGWNILCHEEGLEPSKKGGSLAGIVAQRPSCR
ncbi:MAG: methyltransferase domain-containing protein [Desulfuromonas sp.]|nr:methyltransferase domain-containing protein [Desulfuromonas sp.]